MEKNKKLLSLSLLLVVCLFFSTTTAFSQQSSGQLFEKALYTEEVKGELQNAIDLYQQILKNNPKDREVAAKSLLHLGICYEKLGLKQARETYQDVVNKYPDQQGEVAMAKERLNRLLALQDVPDKSNFRKIRIPTELSWNVALSPDGKELLLVSDKKLWIMPLSGNLGSDFPGKPVQINTEGIEVEWTGLSWSGDGKWIAFNELPLEDTLLQKKGDQSIYVVPVEGGNPKKVHENYRSARTVNYKISLSRYGENLAFTSIENDLQHIQTISVEGGNPQLLTDMQSREPIFSPDGKLIAFVEDKHLGVGGGGLWVMPASGGSPTLVAQAGKASSPVWSPDASKIAFLDHTDNKKIFIMPVDQDGKPTGRKIIINAPKGFENVPLIAGWNTDNKIGALMVRQKEFALYTLPEQGGQAALVVHGVRPTQPRWTPDGKYIQFLKMAGENSLPPNNALAVAPAEGGAEIEILSGSEDSLYIMGYQSGIRISPDGNKIVMAASHWGEIELFNNYPPSQIWTTTNKGDNPTKITHPLLPYTDISPCWSPGGKHIVFLRIKLQEGVDLFGECGIYTINSSGEEQKLLISESDKWIMSLNWSPDGKWIAYLSRVKEPPYESFLNVINMESGESNIVSKVPSASANVELAWSPDSRQIAFCDGEGKVIKIISLKDGSIQDIETGLVDTYIYHLDWAPNGERFVFVGMAGGKKEFWLMENFLPNTETK